MRTNLSQRLKSRRAVAAVAAPIAVLVFAAVALAVTPAPGTFTGSTGQDEAVSIKVNAKHRIKKFVINWWAPCKKPGKTWGTSNKPDGTQDKDGKGDKIKQPGDGSFSDEGSYSKKPDSNGFQGHFKVKLEGMFTTPTAANGTFDVHVKVTRNGNKVDTCHRKVHWHVP
jgi:hypothetical protein